MWKRIEQKILQVNKATGIEIIILADDSIIVHIVETAIKGHTLTKVKEFNSLHQLEELKDKVNPSIPVSIVINGKGILIRKSTSSASGKIQSVLPNANPNDFYYEEHRGTNTEYISIARKETVDGIIRKLKHLGYDVISISIGFNAVSNILPFLKVGKQKIIETDSMLLEFGTDNNFIDFKLKEQINHNKYHPEDYLLANQYIKSASILSFAAAAGTMATSPKNTEGINRQVLQKEREEYRYSRLFSVAGWTLLLSMLIILLASFLVHNKYYGRNQKMAQTKALSSQQDHQYKTLEKDIRRKEKFLERSGWTTSGRSSFYADRVASLIPEDIMLTSMQIYPPRITTHNDAGNSQFKKDTILISGISHDPVDLNFLMNSIRVLPDFKEAILKSYTVRNKNETGVFSMEIIVR